MANPAPAIAPPLSVAAPELPGETAAQALRRQPLGLGLLGLYGSGAIVDACSTVFLGTFLYFYLTAVCGLSGTLTGLALGISLAVDSFVDPLFGSLSDNSRSRFGRRHPFMLASIIPIVICLGLLFSVPTGLKSAGLMAYVLALSLGLRMSLSGFGVPYTALGGELSDSYNERSTIVAFRVGVGAIGTISILVLGYGVFLSAKSGGQLNRAAYTPFAWSGAAVMASAALLSTLGTLGARARLHGAAHGEGHALGRLVKEVGEVFRNSSFLFLFVACLVFFIGFGASGALALHATTFFWRLSPSSILIVSLSGIPGLMIGIVISGVLTRVFEKRTIAIAGLCLIALCQLSPVTLRLSGALPPGETAPVVLLMCSTLLLSVGVAFALVGFQSMMADAADEHDVLFGARREGLYFAGISFAVKASSGLGVMIAGFAADAIGFPNNLAARGPHVSVPWGKAVELALIYGPGASVITMLGILLLFGYRIDRAAHARIIDALTERRSSPRPA
ncbi:MAG TPA: MFS transporter [Caulobacteraceae bacterium]|jgi:GPH family glycoside/pentoside/hexuronide:cation symporter|nr:MFS transporter [Caulobacteraceae bacterium]